MHSSDAESHDSEHHCGGDCPLTSRRRFLGASLLAVGALAALGATPGHLAAMTLREGRAAARGDERSYPLPAADGATIDRDNDVILVRWQGRVYAFDLSCPHQNTALRWEAGDARFQCPKHHSKYQPDGTFISGRATRSMDRFAVRRDGGNVVVDLSQLFRQDKEPAEWTAASVAV